MDNVVRIYTDGACKNNPGPGGWAAILTYNGAERGLSGYKLQTTNNEMELTALYQALLLLKTSSKLEIYADSKYVVDSISKGWVFNWIKKGEINKRPNGELWLATINELRKHEYTLHWVKGHNGHKYNEMCDVMAVQQRDFADNVVKDTGSIY